MSVDPADLRTHNEWPPGSLLSRLDDSTRQALLTAGTCRRVGSSTVLMRQGENAEPCDPAPAFVGESDRADRRRPRGVARHSRVRRSGRRDWCPQRPPPLRHSRDVRQCHPSMSSLVPELRARRSAQYPEVAIHLAGVVAERLCWANRRRLDFTAYPVKIRLARALAELAATYGRATFSGSGDRCRTHSAGGSNAGRGIGDQRAASVPGTEARGTGYERIPPQHRS